MIRNLIQQAEDWVWGTPPADLAVPRRWAVIAARLVHVLIRDIFDGQITMRAMGLVYTTLLSLVPLLALSFSLLKAFGIHNALQPVLLRFLSPIGDGAAEIAETIIGFVENIKVGVLGVVGLGLLLYGVISLIQKVEGGCNYIWQVRQPRSLGRRFSEYLSVLIVGPLVILSATSMTASVTSNALVQQIAAIEPFGTTLLLVGKLLPFFLYSAGFTFLFLFMPNTRVRLLPAAAGGMFSGVLWQTASLAFASFASGASNVNAIYSSFALLIFLLIWLYVSWLIMLLGCRVAFLLQHPEQLNRGDYPPRLGAAREESLALQIMAQIGHRYIGARPPWQQDELAHHLHAVPAHVYDIVDRLTRAGLLAETGPNDSGVLPRRDIDSLTVDTVLEAVRTSKEALIVAPREDRVQQRVAETLRQLQDARSSALAGMTIRQLAADGTETVPSPAPVAPYQQAEASV